MAETKRWKIKYSHNDGRSGTVEVTTEISKSEAFEYGNGKCGVLTIDGYPNVYDLRYSKAKDLHIVMIENYFGDGLVSATEI